MHENEMSYQKYPRFSGCKTMHIWFHYCPLFGGVSTSYTTRVELSLYLVVVSIHSQKSVKRQRIQCCGQAIAVTSTVDYLKNDDTNGNLPWTYAAIAAETHHFRIPAALRRKSFQVRTLGRSVPVGPIFCGETSRK